MSLGGSLAHSRLLVGPAGPSADVLLWVDAKCISGQEDAARHRVALALDLSE